MTTAYRYVKPYLSASKSAITSIAAALCLFVSCTTHENKNNILDQLGQLPGFKRSPDAKAVIIISDNSCIPCNESFSDFVANLLNDHAVQFVIAAHADHLDLTPYVNSSRKDIVYDTKSFLIKNKVIKSSTVIFTKNGIVDTTITIDAKQLNDQLSYIKSRI